jgi:uncharacterized delta-60 repeat protein
MAILRLPFRPRSPRAPETRRPRVAWTGFGLPSAARPLVLGLVLLAGTPVAAAQEGYFDPGFGQGTGRVAPPGAESAYPDGPMQLRIDSAGRLLVAYGRQSSMALMRLRGDGSYDLFGPSFSGRSTLTPPAQEYWSYRTLALGPDDRPVVTFFKDNPTLARRAARVLVLDPEGYAPDPGFGTGTGYSAPIGQAQGAVAWDSVVDAAGRILLVGHDATQDFVAWRLDASMQVLDPGFGTAGRRQIGFDLGGDGIDDSRVIALDPQERILVAGTVQTATSTVIGVVRLSPQGNPDPAFGAANGRIVLPYGGIPRELIPLPDGRYLLASNRGIFSREIVLHVFDGTGTPDPGYGACGGAAPGERVLRFSSGGTPFDNSVVSDVLLQPDGKLLVAGEASGSGFGATRVAAMQRLDAAGCPDPTFGFAGQSLANLDPTGVATVSFYRSIALGNGGLMAAGVFYTADAARPALARLQIDPALLPPEVFDDGFEAR